MKQEKIFVQRTRLSNDFEKSAMAHTYPAIITYFKEHFAHLKCICKENQR